MLAWCPGGQSCLSIVFWQSLRFLNELSSTTLVVFHVVSVLLVGAQEANITIPPQSVNTTLNGVAIFNCTYVGDIVRWEANNQKIFDGQNGYEFTDVPVTSTSVMSTLTVVTSLDKNNTNITCIAVNLDLTTSEKEPALLLLQGLLESVKNLTVTPVNSTTVLISWSPPFTLEGVPILGYNVIITNNPSGKNETMLVEDTTLLYSIDHPDPENNFTVTVAPINEVGAGQPATPLSFIFNIVTKITSSVGSMIALPTIAIYGHKIFPLTSTIRVTATYEFNTVSVGPVIITKPPDSSVAVSALMAMNVIIMVTVLSIVVIMVSCYLLKKYKIRVSKAPLQDVVPVHANPAYQLVTIQRTDELHINQSSVISSHSTTQQTITTDSAAVSHQYENAVEVNKKYRGDGNEHDYENMHVDS